VAGGGQGAAVLGGLDDDGAAGQRGVNAITGQEPAPAGQTARRAFADHGPADGDVREQPGVRAGIGDVGTAGQHGDGDASGGQGAVVSGGIDAVGATETMAQPYLARSAALEVAACLP
jgi:hypothetical protein